jgi:hypothetical protein
MAKAKEEKSVKDILQNILAKSGETLNRKPLS